MIIICNFVLSAVSFDCRAYLQALWWPLSGLMNVWYWCIMCYDVCKFLLCMWSCWKRFLIHLQVSRYWPTKLEYSVSNIRRVKSFHRAWLTRQQSSRSFTVLYILGQILGVSAGLLIMMVLMLILVPCSPCRASMIWIIGEYAERIDNADELLESFLDGFQDENTQVHRTHVIK